MNQYSSSAMKAHSLRDRLRETTSLAILDAAEQVAAAQGIAGSSLSAIAEQAGVAVGTIYNYFKDKDELFKALFSRRRDEYYEMLDATEKAHAKESFADQLHAFVSTAFEFYDARRIYLRIALETDQAAPYRDSKTVMKHLQDRAERLVKVGIKEKKLRDITVDRLALVLVFVLKGFLQAGLAEDRRYAGEVDAAVEFFMRGASR
jgi:AcrR family transcriptional regulator